MYQFNMHEFSNFMEYWGEKKKKKRKRSRKFACLDYRETWNNYESTKAISFFYPVSRRRCVHARISHGNIETLPSSDHAISPIKERNTTTYEIGRFSFTLIFNPH